MKLIVDVQDNRVSFFLELIKSLSFVKAKPITKERALLMEEIVEAVKNVRLAKEGKIRAKPLNELLDEI